MKPLIKPIDSDLIEIELKDAGLLRKTNKAGNELYVVDYFSSPNTLAEIGRLRELTFRDAGGGTGKACDLDKFDIDGSSGCKQLVLWNPEEKEIVGGYRFIYGSDVKMVEGKPWLTSEHLFDYSDEFIADFLPFTIELGRSFICPKYQGGAHVSSTKSLFALDNLWDGLGALIVNYNAKYLFGKASIYPSFGQEGFLLMRHFLDLYFKGSKPLVCAKSPIEMEIPASVRDLFSGNNYKEDYVVLKRELKNLDRQIPPLINAYMNVSPTMIVFDSTMNVDFGNVYETGLLVKTADMYPEKVKRHMEF
ncbi:MAG: GNAT family N-acetyltransferase [Paludibacteraceae bacterium]|nr:GNAT family N-acetyltransferase [Paludibacteraceae bacterium]